MPETDARERPPASDAALPQRGAGWQSALCLVLLSATLSNYAARQVVPASKVRICEELQISNEAFGAANGVFSIAFAVGAVVFGAVADRVSVRWLYPVMVSAWSLVCWRLGHCRTYNELWWGLLALGLCEAGHWPCALRTTQRSFEPSQRPLANSLLQAGASVGAILVAILVLTLVSDQPGSWRSPTWGVALLAAPWVIAWLALVREEDFQRPVRTSDAPLDGATGGGDALPPPLLWRRFAVLLVVVVAINICWHFARVWSNDVLEKGLGYAPRQAQQVMIGYWAATFVGSILSGNLSRWLTQRGWSVHGARLTVYLAFAAGTAVCGLAMFLPPGAGQLALFIGFGLMALGLFPVYYSLTQDLSPTHQGKINGVLGLWAWLPLYFVLPAVGRTIDAQPELRRWLFAGAGLLPLAAGLVIAVGWGKRNVASSEAVASQTPRT